jgi:ribosomal protein S18 acetylase RimI-like enzyme
MFIDLLTAARIDRAEAELCAGVARRTDSGVVLPIAGGLAIFTTPGSPINKVIGLGFEGHIDEAELVAVESAWGQRNEPVRIELCTLTEPGIAQMFSARGYQLMGFENQLGRQLGDLRPAPGAGIRVQATDSDADLNAWKDISVTAFTSMDGTGSVVDEVLDRGEMERIMVQMTSAPGFRRYLAHVNGQPVGAASMRFDNGLAQMSGAGTLPAFRGRGIQKALVHQRLLEAQEEGCDIAVVTTAPGSRSQQNMMKRGFALLYARAILVKGWA